ncbi:MAG: radical SAM protein [Candidatus Bathyarchaeia archaeon]
MSRLTHLFEFKKKISDEFRNMLSPESKAKAEGDHHSRRKPRPCGMTIHTGVGCSYICTYCYIYDMGFAARPKPYPLKPEEIVYALTLNPYIVPERTLAAYGSVTEPFLPETTGRALVYMRDIYRWLRLPAQVSTKAILEEEILREIAAGDPKTSILVTAVTLSDRRIEPRAPDPAERIRSAGEASRRGFEVSLFMRPIIPGITDVEAEKILKLAADSGIRSAVLGSLRVTERILRNLGRCGVNIEEIKRRLAKPLSGSRQIEVRSADLKRRIKRIAEDLGFSVFKAACEANVYAHGRRCSICNMGPCNINGRLEPVENNDIKDLFDYLNVRYRDVNVAENVIKVTLRGKGVNERLKYVISAATYRRIVLDYII